MQNSIIKDYHIQRELGRGGMATVYLAHDNKFDTNVAVKVLSKKFTNDENIRKRFLAEAKNMFKMSHPNIIKVTDLIEEGDTVAFVMEYIEGETLKEYIDRKGKLSDEEIKNLFTQMLDAVGYVHEQNLVHRDIKPSNFMLDKKGIIKLMDFGIAKNMDVKSSEYTHTGTNQSMGTPMYMSPEQIKSTKEVTLQSDIYSLGVVLWQMVMGQKPYDVQTLSTFELQTKIVNEPLENTNSIWDIQIQKACAKNREERFQNCNAWLSELNNPTSAGNTEDKTVLANKVNDDATQLEQQTKNTTNTNKRVANDQTQAANANQETQHKINSSINIAGNFPQEKKSKIRLVIGVLLLSALLIIFGITYYNHYQRSLILDFRKYRDMQEDNGKVYVGLDLWKRTINKGEFIDYDNLYREMPDQIIFPMNSKELLACAIDNGCFPSWLEKNREGQGMEIGIWNDKPVFWGFNSKDEIIVFYSDMTAENTKTKEKRRWVCLACTGE